MYFLIHSRNLIQDWLSNSTDKGLALPTMNSYQRRLMYQEVPKRFNSFISLEKTSFNQLSVKKLTVEEKESKISFAARLRNEVQGLLGFSMVMDALLESKKPLLGHNLLM